MMTDLRKSPSELMDITWAELEPHYIRLEAAELTAETLRQWLSDWNDLNAASEEASSRIYVATSVNTEDSEAEARLERYVDEIYPKVKTAEQALKSKLLKSGLSLPEIEIPLKKLEAETSIFKPENLPLQSEESKLGVEYDKILGAQAIEWEGKTTTLAGLGKVYHDSDREKRQKAWEAEMGRRLQDREALNSLWTKFLKNRVEQAKNATGTNDYRKVMWPTLHRFDYSPDDCARFHDAIEKAVVPAARELYSRHKEALGLDTLRPWDTSAPHPGQEALKPYQDIRELEEKPQQIFNTLSPQLGAFYQTMRNEGLLDLDNRKGKAPGGYCTSFPQAKRPFIFMNGVGIHDDVQTMLHEAGHAFHAFLSFSLPYHIQQSVNTEFAEVASMSMELLSSPYLEESRGGFYSAKQAAQARIEHLTRQIHFWPYMAVVDSFQQWVYANPEVAMDPAECDNQWVKCWRRFMVGTDYSGYEDVEKTGWHRKLHIYQVPLYYIEYGLAQLGAVQVWAHSLNDPAKALKDYCFALSLGGTRSLPDLFSAAGANFSLDASTLQSAVDLMMSQIEVNQRAMS